MKINWMPRAVQSFFQITDYIEDEFGTSHANKFIDKVGKTIDQIEQNPYMYKATKKNSSIRKGFVSKFTSIFYKVRKQKEEIDLIEFWDNRQNPE